jgi:hypothetical protein
VLALEEGREAMGHKHVMGDKKSRRNRRRWDRKERFSADECPERPKLVWPREVCMTYIVPSTESMFLQNVG